MIPPPPPDAAAAAEAKAPVRRRRWLRRLVLSCLVAALLAGVALWWALGHLAHPLIKGRVAAFADDLIGAKLDYDDGSVDLGHFELHGLRIANAAADDALVGDLLHIGHIDARFDAFEVVERFFDGGTIRVRNVEVADVHVGVVVGGSGGSSVARALRLPADVTPTEPLRPSQAFAALDLLTQFAAPNVDIGPIAIHVATAIAPHPVAIVRGASAQLRAGPVASGGVELHMRFGGSPLQVEVDLPASRSDQRTSSAQLNDLVVNAVIAALPAEATAVVIAGRPPERWLRDLGLPWKHALRVDASVTLGRNAASDGSVNVKVNGEDLRWNSAAIEDWRCPLGARFTLEAAVAPGADIIEVASIHLVGLSRVTGGAFVPIDSESGAQAVVDASATVRDAVAVDAPIGIEVARARVALALPNAPHRFDQGPLHLTSEGVARASLDVRDVVFAPDLALAATATVALGRVDVTLDGVGGGQLEGLTGDASLRGSLGDEAHGGATRAQLAIGLHGTVASLAATLGQRLNIDVGAGFVDVDVVSTAPTFDAALIATLAHSERIAASGGVGHASVAVHGPGVSGGDRALIASARADAAKVAVVLRPSARGATFTAHVDHLEAKGAGVDVGIDDAQVRADAARAEFRALSDPHDGVGALQVDAHCASATVTSAAASARVQDATMRAKVDDARLDATHAVVESLVASVQAATTHVTSALVATAKGATAKGATAKGATAARAELTLRTLTVPLAKPTAMTCKRLVAEARMPGVLGLLDLSALASLRWRGELGITAPRALATLWGVAWPQGVGLGSVRLHSEGQGRGVADLAAIVVDGGLAALAGGAGARAVAAVALEHEASATLTDIVVPLAKGSASAASVVFALQGSGHGLSQKHTYTTTLRRVRAGAPIDLRFDQVAAAGAITTTGAGLALTGLTANSALTTDGDRRGNVDITLARGPTWTLAMHGEMPRLGRLGAVVQPWLPCVDAGRISAEGDLSLRIPAPAGDDPRVWLKWIDAPKSARFALDGKAEVHGLRCIDPQFALAAANVRATIAMEVARGRVKATLGGVVKRADGAYSQHALKLTSLQGVLSLDGPLDAQLHGLDVSVKGSLGRLEQAIVPGYRVADVEASLLARTDGAGRLNIERAAFRNPAGGTDGWLKGRVDRIGLIEGDAVSDGVPGARGAAISGEGHQDVGALGGVAGVSGSGVASLVFAIESGDFRVLALRARAKLANVSLAHRGLDVDIKGVSGEIPLVIDVAMDSNGLRPLGGGHRSAWARWRYQDQHPFLPGDHFVSVQQVRWRQFSLGPMAANMSVDRDVFHLDQLELDALGGHITGQCVIELDGARTRVLLRGNATGLRMADKEGRLDANAALVVEPWQYSVEGRAQVLRMSRDHLEVMLDAFDPFREDLQANRARLALKLGYPKQVRLRFRHGFADVLVELGGLADLVRIDEIVGIPLGPLMGRVVAPLLGEPPP